MLDIRAVTPEFAVAPQLELSDIPAVAADGFTMIINNRPDGEAPGQPPSDAMKAAAEAAGLHYAHVPVVGMPTMAQVEEEAEIIRHHAHGPVLAYCRSGTRSVTLWALGQRHTGERTGADLLELTATAGYDLSAALG